MTFSNAVKMANLTFSGAGNIGAVDKNLKIISKKVLMGNTDIVWFDTSLLFTLPMQILTHLVFKESQKGQSCQSFRLNQYPGENNTHF